jgi:hypothetical protein
MPAARAGLPTHVRLSFVVKAKGSTLRALAPRL